MRGRRTDRREHGPPVRRRGLLVLVGISTVLTTLGCAAGIPVQQAFPAPAAAPPLPVTKLLVVVTENHSLRQARQQMPYTWWLARRFGYARGYRAISYPSLPNYLAMISGHTHGLTSDVPAPASMPGHTVFGRAIAAGRTAAVYVGGMTTRCGTSTAGGYGVARNPWVLFAPERRACRRGDLPLPHLWPAVRRGRLPNAGMVVPDRCRSGHSCALDVADAWVRRLMTRVFAGPDWRSGHLAVVLTADEDDRHHGNKVLTLVVHPSQHRRVVDAPLNHFSIARLYGDVTGTPYLHDASTAPSLSDAFGLPVGH